MADKVYNSTGGKAVDFLLGFFVLGGALEAVLRFGLIGIIRIDYSLVVPALAFAALSSSALAIYLYGRRKFLGIGFAAVLIGHVLAVSPYLLMLLAR